MVKISQVVAVLRGVAHDLELDVRTNGENYSTDQEDALLEAARQIEALAEDLETCG